MIPIDPFRPAELGGETVTFLFAELLGDDEIPMGLPLLAGLEEDLVGDIKFGSGELGAVPVECALPLLSGEDGAECDKGERDLMNCIRASVRL